jgi:hypothetical protein
MARKALEISPKNIDIISLSIITKVPQGKLEEALELCDTVLKLQPGNTFIIEQRLWILIRMQQLIRGQHSFF